MINKISYESLGHVNHGWLEARHHFSFGSYQDPNRTGFGDLVVINDDLIAAQSGFATLVTTIWKSLLMSGKGQLRMKIALGIKERQMLEMFKS